MAHLKKNNATVEAMKRGTQERGCCSYQFLTIFCDNGQQCRRASMIETWLKFALSGSQPHSSVCLKNGLSSFSSSVPMPVSFVDRQRCMSIVNGTRADRQACAASPHVTLFGPCGASWIEHASQYWSVVLLVRPASNVATTHSSPLRNWQFKLAPIPLRYTVGLLAAIQSRQDTLVPRGIHNPSNLTHSYR